VTLPSPCPSTADVNVTQLTGEVARQEHSRATAIVSVPVPPAAPNDPVEFEMFASQRPEPGAVTFVEVELELPQAAAPAAAMERASTTNGRGVRTCTERDGCTSLATLGTASAAKFKRELTPGCRMEFSSGTRLSNPLRTSPLVRALRQLCLVVPVLVLTGCAGGHTLVARETPTPAGPPVAWLTPAFASDALVLSRWRAGVGSPLVVDAPATAPRSDALTVVSWNIALGAGDVIPFVKELQSSGHRAIVLLIQEAFRSGDDIPQTADCAFAGFLGNSKPEREIDAVAQALGFSLYYAPSMRNGAPGRYNEDRGNAILTNLDLDDLVAIELPFERQRRVAVAATVRGTSAGGTPWSLRLVSAHFDNTGSMRRAWIGGEFGRARQARGLRDALRGDAPLIVGGDFNTWFGFSDRAYQELAREYPQTRVTDPRRTFRGLLRLDHVFYRVPPQWNVRVRRGETARGSDHHPLIATVTLATENTENTEKTAGATENAENAEKIWLR
jgi:endonuclease/exonuclease/phosphatase family metal-dependent hydrolase